MRRLGVLVGVLLFLSIGAAAQGPAGVGGSSRSAPASTNASVFDLTPWQLAIGYQYNRDNLTGSPFNANGINASIARYFGRWFGLEAQVGLGFGNTGLTTVPPSLTAHSIFVGGGPRLAYRSGKRIEPWIHGTVGMEHFRFTQTAGVLGSNYALAWTGGGGIDFRLRPHVAARLEGDVVWSRFFSLSQRSFQAVAGAVFDF